MSPAGPLPPLSILLAATKPAESHEDYLANLAASLIERGHRVGLLSDGSSVGLSTSWPPKVTMHGLPSPREWREQVPALAAARYQLVHAQDPVMAPIAQRLAHALDAPYLLTEHEPRTRLQQRLFRAWSREIVVTSEAVRRHLHRYGRLRPERIRLSFLAVDTTRFTADAAARKTVVPDAINPMWQDETVVLGLTGITKPEGRVAGAVLQAIASLHAVHLQARLRLIAPANAVASLHQRSLAMAAPGGRPLVQVLGPQENLPYWLGQATVAVAIGLNALRAMACGVPVVTLNETGTWALTSPANFNDLARHAFGINASGSAPGDGAALAREVNRVLVDPATARTLAEGNARLVRARHSLAALGENMERIYHDSFEP